MAYAIGHISGCRLSPAVTAGLIAAGRFDAAKAPGCVAAQLAGATLAAAVLYVVAIGRPDFSLAGSGFAANGDDDLSPGKYGLTAGFLVEATLTFFLIVTLGSTDRRAPAGFAPLALGSCLTPVHLISSPATNTSVNPARSTSQAIFTGGAAL